MDCQRYAFQVVSQWFATSSASGDATLPGPVAYPVLRAMTSEKLGELPKYLWMESRIPARDALSTFAYEAPEPDPVLAEMQDRGGGSRWFPIQGGHRVLIPFDVAQAFALMRGCPQASLGSKRPKSLVKLKFSLALYRPSA